MNAKYLFILAHLYFNCAFSQDIRLKPYYHNQLGFEIGLGGAGERNVPFLFGLQVGTFYRIGNHQFGLRAAQFSRGLFYSRDDCTTINLYYGFTFASKYVSISPQIGGGYLNRYDDIRNTWHRYNLETVLEFGFTKQGNGIYIRPFFTWNPLHNYLGITMGGRFGNAWMKKSDF